jgi:ribosomal protein L24E
MVERLIATIGTERFEKGVEASARDGIDFIESGRWSEFLEEASQMFNRLDDDERDLFTRRNPDVVEWVTVHDEANGYNPMERRRNDARVELGPNGARDPPMYVRDRGSAPPNDDLIESMIQRRRSYRNWTPQEFQDVLDMGEITVTEGRAREIEMRTPEILDTMSQEGAFPIDVGAKEVTRELLGRVEAGRFMSMLDVLMTFYVALDLDERRMFSRRNPGLIMWVSVYGESNHLIHQEQLKAHTYPTLREK